MLISFVGEPNMTGKKAEQALDKAGIVVNKNTVPFDPEKPFVTSGIRIGTPSVTTRGMGTREMETIADFIDRALKNRKSEEILADIAREVAHFSGQYPLYSERLQETI
jgi:glycine hydroxymethyltransferase